MTTTPDGPAPTPEAALAHLRAGNARFVDGESHVPTVQKSVIAGLADGQRPWATILGCSDSRVSPEVVFDAGLGELFVIRVAGNVLGPSINGTLQYAGTHLRTPLFVVLGHEGCGAVDAALASRFRGTEHKERIEILLEHIVPALDGLDPSQPHDDLLHAAVEANVRRTVDLLRSTPEASEGLATRGMMLVGAIYDLASGRVRFLD
jgi:carbonic anhydrase